MRDLVQPKSEGVVSLVLYDEAMHAIQNVPGAASALVILNLKDGSAAFLKWKLEIPQIVILLQEALAFYQKNPTPDGPTTPTA